MRPSLRAAGLIAILLGVGVFQAWFLDVHFSNLAHGRSSGDLTDGYTAALAHGHSYLLGSPMESGAGSGQDVSNFQGENYIYYGIGPFVLLLVPWHILTGTFLSTAACILGGLLVGYAAYGGALWLLFRHDRRPAVAWLLPAAFLALIAGSGTWTLLVVPRINQMELAWAYAASGAAVACLTAAWTGETCQRLALGGAALAAGLIVACRPNCLPAAVALMAMVGYLSARPVAPLRRKVAAALTGLAPALVVALALAAWNFVRFGNICEFGMRYGTGAVSHPAYVAFSPANVIYNLHRYLVGGIRWGRYFPFIEGVKEGPFPLPFKTHEPVDEIYGAFLLFPVLVFAACALWKRKRESGTLLLAVAGNLLLLSGLGFGSYRYASDYLGILSFVGGLGVCCLADLTWRLGRWLAAAALGPLLLWSVAAGLCETVAISLVQHEFGTERPGDYARLGRPFDQLVYRIERATKTGPRAIRLTLSLPTGTYGVDEPLLVYGDAGLEDFIYLRYPEPEKLQVGFESIGRGGPVSSAFKIDYGRPHVVDLSLGNLLPPDDHPLLKAMDRDDLARARGFVRIAIDGQVVLAFSADLHPARGRLLWGESPDDGAFGRKFTGTLWRIERPLLSSVGIYPAWRRDLFGPIAFTIKVEPVGARTSQPLVSLGYRPSGGILVLDRESAAGVRLKWIKYGSPAVYSQPIDWSYERPHSLIFSVGSLFPPVESSLWRRDRSEQQRAEAKRAMTCSVDGREVWRMDLVAPEVSPESVKLGVNGLSLPGVADAVDGVVLSSRREPW